MVKKHYSEEEPEIKQKIITTGVVEIDKRLGGGIPCGSLTLIEGQSDAGKSVLSQQLTWGSLRSRQNTVFFTTENTVKSLVTQMESLGLGIMDYLLMGWMKIYPMQPNKQNVCDYYEILLDTIKRLQGQYELFVIDSITPMIAYTDLEDSLSYFDRCKSLCGNGCTVMNVAHSYAFNEEMLIRIRSMCDAHFRLSIEEVGDKLLKTLEVAKVRGADKATGNIISFDVEPGMGMKILPLSKANV